MFAGRRRSVNPVSFATQVHVQTGERRGLAGPPALCCFQLVEVLEELSSKVRLIAGNFRHGGVVQEHSLDKQPGCFAFELCGEPLETSYLDMYPLG